LPCHRRRGKVPDTHIKLSTGGFPELAAQHAATRDAGEASFRHAEGEEIAAVQHVLVGDRGAFGDLRHGLLRLMPAFERRQDQGMVNTRSSW
jgi:hypothetical protein